VRRLVVFLTLLSGCATAEPIVRLHPADADVVWRSGRGIMERRLNGARVAMAFERQDEGRLVFRVEVENSGPDRVDIDSRNLAHVSCVGGVCSAQRAVMDPEGALVAIDAARARERANSLNEAAFNGVLLLLSATATVGAVASGDGRTAGRLADDSAALAADAERSAANSDRTIDRLGAERASWEALALRRTTLFPGHALAAEVYVPIDPRVTAMRVGVRVRQESCWFVFNQVVVANYFGGSARPHARTGPHHALEEYQERPGRRQ
jgi:hypothetical protein